MKYFSEFLQKLIRSSTRRPRWLSWMCRPTGDQEGRGFNTRRGRQHSFVEIDHEIFSTVILSLPLIQEGQLSVSGERLCTILVNRLEDQACPVNVWLGKLTALDMTPLGCLGRKTSTQTKVIYSSLQIHLLSFKALALTIFEIFCWQSKNVQNYKGP